MNSILIGKIVNIHGIKGEVKIYPYTDDIENLAKTKVIYLDKALEKKCDITCRVQKNMLLVKIKGIDTVEQAETLRDKEVYISRDSLEELEEDSYYIEDLLNLDVVDMNGNDIGILKYIFNTGANDVYEIETKEHGRIYLPAIRQVIKKVDIENKKIYVEIMKGLI
ncbi:MAG: ribosome maturation factor RimM [Clostridia bacterium]|nr:ribosome maturation factor RimM [Clostridia bacterium]